MPFRLTRHIGLAVEQGGQHEETERLWAIAFDFLRDEVTRGKHSTTFGLAVSEDGLHWPAHNGRKVDVSLASWVRCIRTPHTPLRELDGSYTLFFTAHGFDDFFRGVGQLSLTISAAVH